MIPEGELSISLQVNQARVRSVDIRSTRADVAGLMLQGRTRDDISAAVPLLFSICGRSQAAASELACSAADGGPGATAADLDRCRNAVAAEMLRESAWRALLEWPRWSGEQPNTSDIAAARAANHRAPAAQADIARAVFGMPAGDWLNMSSADALGRWADARQTGAARFIGQLRGEEDDAGADGAPADAATPLLANRNHANWIPAIALAADREAGFSGCPTVDDHPAETGALARLQTDPLVSELLAGAGSRVLPRFVARLRELALLLLGQAQPALGALRLPGGIGVGWVETARGLLVHQTRWQHGRSERYRITAPTEWNFHPRGALPRSLVGAPAGNPTRLRQTATRLARSLDPCVAFELELHGA